MCSLPRVHHPRLRKVCGECFAPTQGRSRSKRARNASITPFSSLGLGVGVASPDRERIGAEVVIGVVSRTRVGDGEGVAVGDTRAGSATGVWALAGSSRPSPARPTATSVAG